MSYKYYHFLIRLNYYILFHCNMLKNELLYLEDIDPVNDKESIY